MIKTLIADDEKPALDRLKDLMADYNQFQIIAEAQDGTEALEKIGLFDISRGSDMT